MAEIHIVFPQGGGAVVHDDPKPVIKGQYLFWHVHSRNTGVAAVRIQFEDTAATYFPVGGTLQSWFQQPLAKGPTIWGKVPPAPPDVRRRDKYTVTGFDASGATVAVIDPVIITEDP